MKKAIKFITLSLTVILFTFVAAFAQDTLGGGTSGGSSDPLALIFASVATLAAVVLPITGWIATHIVKGSAQIISWIVALALASVGHYMNLGVFGEYSWFWTLGYGFIAALTANGMADTSMVKAILTAIAAKAKLK